MLYLAYSIIYNSIIWAPVVKISRNYFGFNAPIDIKKTLKAVDEIPYLFSKVKNLNKNIIIYPNPKIKSSFFTYYRSKPVISIDKRKVEAFDKNTLNWIYISEIANVYLDQKYCNYRYLATFVFTAITSIALFILRQTHPILSCYLCWVPAVIENKFHQHGVKKVKIEAKKLDFATKYATNDTLLGGQFLSRQNINSINKYSGVMKRIFPEAYNTFIGDNQNKLQKELKKRKLTNKKLNINKKHRKAIFKLYDTENKNLFDSFYRKNRKAVKNQTPFTKAVIKDLADIDGLDLKKQAL